MSDKHPVSCPHRPDCDGCPLLEQSAEAKRQHKRERLTDHLPRYPNLKDTEMLPLLEAEHTLGYRNRARMVVLPEADRPEAILGFYKQNSRDPVIIEKCLAHVPELESILLDLRPLLFNSPLKHHARFIDARHLGEDAIVTLCMGAPKDEARQSNWLAMATHLSEQLQQRHPRVGVQMSLSTKQQAIGSGHAIEIASPNTLQHTLPPHDVAIDVPPTAFFQLHTEQLHHAHQLMRQWMTTSKAMTILDLYCGIGVHGLGLSDIQGRVFGSDVNQEAIEAAQKNASTLGIEAHYKALHDNDLAPWMTQHVPQPLDVTIVNPGRAGLSVALINTLAQINSTDFFYLSCEPRTLRRDLDRLCRRGWRVVKMQPLDFMPQTAQVETLALLQHNEASNAQDAYWPLNTRQWPEGISGINIQNTQDDALRLHWIAFVSGDVSAHGQPTHLPKQDNASIQVKKLSAQGPNSWVQIITPVWEDTHALSEHLCQRMRAWRHPILGDTAFGARASNQWFKRKHFGDRVALHCALMSKHASKTLLLAHTPGLFYEWGLET